MKTLFLTLLATFILTACGSSPESSETKALTAEELGCTDDQTYRDEYDCDGSTRVLRTRVINTLWNTPASGQFIADIKNVDITDEHLLAYIGHDDRLRYQVFVRSWVDFGEKTRAITVIDKDQPKKFRYNNRARFVGKDTNGQYIYMISLPLVWGQDHDVYLKIEYRGETHYSNVGEPRVYFKLHHP